MNLHGVYKSAVTHAGLPSIAEALPVGRQQTLFMGWSDKELSKELAANFHKFEDRNNEGFITQRSLKQAAENPEYGGHSWEDSMLAREVLGRESLMDRLDVDSAGRYDGKFGEQGIQDVIRSKVKVHES